MRRKCLCEDICGLLTQTAEIDFVSSGDVSELWGEPLSDNKYGGLIVFVDLEIDGALKQHLP